MKCKRLAAMLLAGALSIFTLSGCFGIEIGTGGETASSPAVICRVGTAQPLTGELFPGFDCSGADRDLQSLIHGAENVTVVTENTYAVNASVISASSVTEGADGSRTYTYTLAGGLFFSDGSPLTAKDYVFSVLLRSSEAFKELGGDNTAYRALSGYEAYASGESAGFAGVRLLSDSKFSLTIDRDSLPSYQEMLLTQVYPLPMAVLAPDAELTDDGSGAAITGLTAESLRETLEGADGYRCYPTVTAGSYMLTGIEGGVYTLAVNPYYAGGYYKRQPSVKNMTVETADLSDGDAYDLIVGVTGKSDLDLAMKLLSADEMAGSLSYDSMVVSSLAFGDDVSAEIRQALSKMIDVQDASEQLAGHWGQEALGNIPLASSLYQSSYGSLSQLRGGTDPIGAEQLLKKAGDGEPIVLTYAYDPKNAEAVAVLDILKQADAQQSLLTIVPQQTTDPDIVVLADLHYEKVQYGKDWGPWVDLNGSSMEEAALDLQNTAYFPYSDRFGDKLLEFEEQYLEQLPSLPLAVYEAYDLYGKRLIGYRDVNIYDDWTVWIQYSRIVDLSTVRENTEG